MQENTVFDISKIIQRSGISEQYEIDQQNPLGTGGFSCVFLGKDKKNGIECAIKIVNPNITNFDEILNEISIAQILKSNNHIINIIGLVGNSIMKIGIILIEKTSMSLHQLLKKKTDGLSKAYLCQMI